MSTGPEKGAAISVVHIEKKPCLLQKGILRVCVCLYVLVCSKHTDSDELVNGGDDALALFIPAAVAPLPIEGLVHELAHLLCRHGDAPAVRLWPLVYTMETKRKDSLASPGASKELTQQTAHGTKTGDRQLDLLSGATEARNMGADIFKP